MAVHSPMSQFEVLPVFPFRVGGFDLTITNQAIWTGVALALILFFLLWGVRRVTLVPGRMQAFVELTLEFIQGMAKDTAGTAALPFVPLLFTTFLMISAMNLLGMVPGSFTTTSQITTTAFMALAVFATVIGVGLYKQGLHFFAMFLPKGTPVFFAPFIIPLEIISFLARPLTLAMRLAINMVAGHILLKLFAGFCVLMVGAGGLVAVGSALPLLVLMAITALEIFVAILQAYIFTILATVYLNDALHGH